MNRTNERTLLREAYESLFRIGLKNTLVVALMRLVDRAFDLRYGTDTASPVSLASLDIDSDNLQRGQRYQATGILPFRKLMRLYPFAGDGVLVDFGSGKGMVLLLASRAGFKRVVGVEFSDTLVSIARNNAERFRERCRASKAEIEVIHGDVVDYAFRNDETVFYFYHPFDERILLRVLRGIEASLAAAPREAWLIYYLPTHRATLERELESFRPVGEHRLSGYECVVYRACPEPPLRNR